MKNYIIEILLILGIFTLQGCSKNIVEKKNHIQIEVFNDIKSVLISDEEVFNENVHARSKILYVSSNLNLIPKTITANVYVSIQDAIDASKGNETILILEGVYYENLVIRNKDNLIIKPYRDHHVIIDGSRKLNNPVELQTSNQNLKDVLVFKNVGSISNYRNIYVKNMPTYIFQDDKGFEFQRISAKNVPSAMQKDSDIWIRTKSLSTHLSCFISEEKPVLFIKESNNIKIDGKNKSLVFRNGGRNNIKIENIKRGNVEHFTIVENCEIINAKIGVQIGWSENTLLIRNNMIYSNLSENFSYSDLKWNCYDCSLDERQNRVRYFETIGVSVAGKDRKNCEISNNEIFGHFNGIFCTTGGVTVIENIIHDVLDDAIEIEFEATNVHITKNFVFNASSSISVVPVTKGPVYIYDNIISQSKEKYNYITSGEKQKLTWSLKFYSNSMGKTHDVHIFNNTFYSSTLPLRIGGNKIEYTPFNCNIINNVFVTENDFHPNFTLDPSVKIESNLFIYLSSISDEDSKVINSKKLNILSSTNDFVSIFKNISFDPKYRTSFRFLKEVLENQYASENYKNRLGDNLRVHEFRGAFIP